MSDNPKPLNPGRFSGRVGQKASGFMSKKFFHPGNMKNQEKLWLAFEAKKEKEKRQDELLQKREDERRVEHFKNELNIGTGVAPHSVQSEVSDATFSIPKRTIATITGEGKALSSETKKRLQMVAKDCIDGIPISSSRIAVKSRYEEDVFENGHSSVWGSYFDTASKAWGYQCCQRTTKNSVCSIRQS